MTTNAAKRLAQSLSKTTVQQADVVDPLAVALMRRLEERGIGKYHLEELEPDPVEERRRALRELVAQRQIGEEAGVEIGAVRYVASQPWPFPSQLMRVE